MEKAEQIAKAQHMRDEGASYRIIGRALGVAHSTARRWLDPTAKAKNLAGSTAWYATHKEQKKASDVAYRRTHKPEKYARNAIRHALKAGFIAGATTAQVAGVVEIYRRAQEDPKVRCYLCGKLIPMGHRHVDHIMPVSKGGTWSPSNLAVACGHCNLSKNDKLPEEIGLLF